MKHDAVLVVEDEPTLLRQITTYFRGRGPAAQGVGTPAEAEAILSGGQIEVLVTDIVLPGASGLELMRRCVELSPDTEVIIITGAPNLPTVEEALRGGAFDYLEKPVRLADLRHRVMLALERVRLVREGREQQAEIRRLNTQLFRKLESSSDELSRTREELAATILLAELGRLTSTVCHELANPLTSLLAAAEFLQGQPAGGSCDHLARVIQASAMRCGRITQMLLDVKRVGSSPTQPVDVSAALAQARTELSARLARSRTRVHERVPADLPHVLADHELLVGCLVNVLRNSLDALANHGGARTLEIVAAARGDEVELRLGDSGPGFAAGALERALEPFFTTKPHSQGTGLGLAIVAATVRSWDGAIEVENLGGGGACVTLSLKAAAPVAGRAAPVPERIAALLAGRRVVLAAPAGDLRELLSLVLGSWGARVTLAGDLAQLLAACREGIPDAVLLDAQGGEVDLPDAYRQLLERHPLAAARVIPMTAVNAADELRTFLHAFPGPVLTKPFGVQRMAEALELVVRAGTPEQQCP